MITIEYLVEEDGAKVGEVRQVMDRQGKALIAQRKAREVGGPVVEQSMQGGDVGRPGQYGGRALRSSLPGAQGTTAPQGSTDAPGASQ